MHRVSGKSVVPEEETWIPRGPPTAGVLEQSPSKLLPWWTVWAGLQLLIWEVVKVVSGAGRSSRMRSEDMRLLFLKVITGKIAAVVYRRPIWSLYIHNLEFALRVLKKDHSILWYKKEK